MPNDSVTKATVKSDRKHLLPAESDCLLQAASEGSNGVRDRAMCLLMLHHGLRVSELIGLLERDLSLDEGQLWARRLKRSRSAMHPIKSHALKALRRYVAIRPKSGFDELFLSRRGEPFCRQGINHLVSSWAARAAIPFIVTPHMLRHTCGYTLINRPGGSKDLLLLRDYMGHKDIGSTMEYVVLAPGRFDELWGI